jgi:hypothetical protein
MATVREHGCDGCDEEFTAAELHPVEMPNGETAICCPECRRHAKTAAEKQADLVATRTCDGCGESFVAEALSEVLLPDGVTVSLCETCEAQAPDPDEATTDADDDAGDAPDDEDVRNRCDGCQEWVAEELWEVVTVDDRTERFCEACKNEGLSDGVVKRVHLKRAEAREILGVDRDPEEAAIRKAYLEQIKRAHPDRDTGSRLAFKRVKRAYDRLADGD